MYKFLSETNEVDKSSYSCFTNNENIVLVGGFFFHRCPQVNPNPTDLIIVQRRHL